MNRALLECIAVREFGATEITEVLTFFGGDPPTCVFCGGPIERWDHLVPVTKGGDTVLGNMVPACSKCDDSKGDAEFEQWAVGAAPGSPRSREIADVEQRVGKIGEYVAKYGYEPRSPDQRLNEEELRQFDLGARISESCVRSGLR